MLCFAQESDANLAYKKARFKNTGIWIGIRMQNGTVSQDSDLQQWHWCVVSPPVGGLRAVIEARMAAKVRTHTL